MPDRTLEVSFNLVSAWQLFRLTNPGSDFVIALNTRVIGNLNSSVVSNSARVSHSFNHCSNFDWVFTDCNMLPDLPIVALQIRDKHPRAGRFTRNNPHDLAFNRSSRVRPAP